MCSWTPSGRNTWAEERDIVKQLEDKDEPWWVAEGFTKFEGPYPRIPEGVGPDALVEVVTSQETTKEEFDSAPLPASEWTYCEQFVAYKVIS